MIDPKECSAAEQKKGTAVPAKGRDSSPPACLFPSIVFWSYWEAAKQGYLSKTQWLKRKRVPLPDAPLGIVVTKSEETMGWGVHPIVRDLGDNSYLIALDWWDAIHKDYTVPIQGKAKAAHKDQVNASAQAVQSTSSFPSVHLHEGSQVSAEGSSCCISSESKSSFPSSSIPLNTSIDRREMDESAIPIEETRGFVIIIDLCIENEP